MKKLLALALCVVSFAANAVPTMLELPGNVIAVMQQVNEKEFIVVANPTLACAAASTQNLGGVVSDASQMGMLMLFIGQQYTSGAAWTMNSTTPRIMPAWAGGYGAEICKWWKANQK